jgi:hypothetical protein
MAQKEKNLPANVEQGRRRLPAARRERRQLRRALRDQNMMVRALFGLLGGLVMQQNQRVNTGTSITAPFGDAQRPGLAGPKPPTPKWYERFRGVLILSLLVFSALMIVVTTWTLLKAPPQPPPPPPRPDMRQTRACVEYLEQVVARADRLQVRAAARGLNPITAIPLDRRLAAELRGQLTVALDREQPLSNSEIRDIRRQLAVYENQLDHLEGKLR